MIIKRHLRLFFLVFFAITLFANAHGSLSKRITQKTSEIKLSPKNAILYFERGFLFQQHEEYDKAVLDYTKAEELGYDYHLLDFRKAETYYKWNKYKLALKSSITCLQKNQSDIKINKLHAQILYKLGQFENAVNYYNYFISNALDPRPEDFVELSILNIEAFNNYNIGIKVLDDGINKLGHVISLDLKKLEYLKASNQTDLVIEQYNHFIISNKRKEFWYYKKGNYLFSVNRKNEALIALKQSKLAIHMLDSRFQKMKSIKNLLTNLDTLEKLLINEN